MDVFALYRGDVLLGHFEGAMPVMGRDGEVGRGGFLKLIDPALPLEPTMQTVSRIIPGVRQHALPQGSDREQSHPVVALKPMTEEEIRGASPEQQFRIGLPD